MARKLPFNTRKKLHRRRKLQQRRSKENRFVAYELDKKLNDKRVDNMLKGTANGGD